MPYVTSFPPSGSPVTNVAVGAFGSNTVQTGLAIPGSAWKVFNFIQNLAASAPLYVSIGVPVSGSQFHFVLPASGAPFVDLGMIKLPIYVSGGSYSAWSM